jgi:hypothetical protein
MAGRREDLEARRVRRQKIFVGVGAGVLLGIVGFEVLPGMLSSSSGGSSSTPPAVAVPKPAVPVVSNTGPKIPRSVEKTAPRDLFVPLVSAGPVNAAAAPQPHFPKGPAVRAKDFVVKNPFVPQIKVPSAPVAPPAQIHPVNPAPAPKATQSVPGAYVVLLGSVPGKGAASRKAAARAVVAAKNAGLKDVVANDAFPGAKGKFTIFTGPYPSAAEAHTELVRALRNGYPHATTQRLKATPSGGF